jgi:hypothetical protein
MLITISIMLDIRKNLIRDIALTTPGMRIYSGGSFGSL